MAKAELKDIEVVVKEEGVVLSLTMSEAQFLKKVLSNIGGDPSGPRGKADAICDALRWADVESADIIAHGYLDFWINGD